MAELSISAGRKGKLVEPFTEMSRGGSAPIGSIQKLAGALRLARASVMGRLGRVALKLLYRFIAERGGSLSRLVWGILGWLAGSLQDPSLRLIRRVDPQPPVRVFSDATVLGVMASFTSSICIK